MKTWDEMTDDERTAANLEMNRQALELHRQLLAEFRQRLAEHREKAEAAASLVDYHEQRVAELEEGLSLSQVV